MNVTISREKLILSHKFPHSTELGPINGKTSKKTAKSANYAGNVLFEKKKVKIMLVMANYSNNYATTNYQLTITYFLGPWNRLTTPACNVLQHSTFL